MADHLSIALAQLNPTVGDLPGNMARIRRARQQAAAKKADLVITAELSVAGYFPEDLIDRPGFTAGCMAAVHQLARDTADGGPALIVGSPWRDDDGRIYNALLLLSQGVIAATRYKHSLPNYSVFDDKRNFTAGPMQRPFMFRGVSLGLLICEDIWIQAPAAVLKQSGADLIIVTNGSTYQDGKAERRVRDVVAERVAETTLPVIFVNQVGGQDEVVYDGASFVVGHDRRIKVQLPSFAEAVVMSSWHRQYSTGGQAHWVCDNGHAITPPKGSEATYRAIMCGVRDYVGKNRFPGVVLGLSGGIDSALAATVAVDALGAEHVHGVLMPSPHSSEGSIEDARQLAENLGIRFDIVPIETGMHAFDAMLGRLFTGTKKDITEENIQSRLRGMVLMAISNKFGSMVLTTGNKSELAVGYATLYGDMCGGFNPLKDVYKTRIYELAQWRNRVVPIGAKGPQGSPIPQASIDKPPSAELRPGQVDQDSLPDYEELDAILAGIIEGRMSIDELSRDYHDRDTVVRVWRMLERAEYKRRQAAPGVKVTSCAFGRDRRYPITNGYRADMLTGLVHDH